MVTNPTPTPVNGLIPQEKRDTMSPIAQMFDWRAYAEMEMRVLVTRLNWWRKQLGMNPLHSKCPHCHGELK